MCCSCDHDAPDDEWMPKDWDLLAAPAPRFTPTLMICPPLDERPWRRATAWHFRDDAHITVAAVFRSRRAFMDAGWETRLIAEASEPFLLTLEVRALPGCAEPTFADRDTPRAYDAPHMACTDGSDDDA